MVQWRYSIRFFVDGRLKCGSRSLAWPMGSMRSPLEMLTVVGGALEVKVLTGALPWQ